MSAPPASVNRCSGTDSVESVVPEISAASHVFGVTLSSASRRSFVVVNGGQPHRRAIAIDESEHVLPGLCHREHRGRGCDDLGGVRSDDDRPVDGESWTRACRCRQDETDEQIAHETQFRVESEQRNAQCEKNARLERCDGSTMSSSTVHSGSSEPRVSSRSKRWRRPPWIVLATTSAFAVGCGATSQPPSNPPVSTPAAVATPAVSAPPGPAAASALTTARLAELFAPLAVAPSAHNLVKNSSFPTLRSLPWGTSFTKPGDGDGGVESGMFCLGVKNAGIHAWDAQFRHREMTLQQGHKYSVRFKIASTLPTTVTAKLAMSGPPYKSYWQTVIDLEGDAKIVDSSFAMALADDPTAEFAFSCRRASRVQAGPVQRVRRRRRARRSEFDPKPDAAPLPIANVLTNQTGYLLGLAKIAIVKSASTTPLAWTLTDSVGRVVTTGKTEVHGPDSASGDAVHTIDFSSVTKPGRGYVLKTDEGISHPFDIGTDVYRKLKYDALAYFYQTRSGIAIEMPYAGDPKWTHPVGHPGDHNVACAPDSGCDYSLDVSGGWYDAGDQGKYVVNGGISVWTLLNLYERAKAIGSKTTDFDDGKMNIPERHNGVPDILDEVRWELEFMMKMQVPDGKPFSGMAHHKIHDKEWTALGTAPDRDPVARFLRPVSTAATLNLAAATGQCARVWRSIDPAFSDRCLKAAERAWNAALAHPAMFITEADTIGGGAYEDDNVKDEFYWAASELYVTTNKATYKEFIAASPHRDSVPSTLQDDQTMSQMWNETAALGTVTMAIVPSAVPKSERDAARAAIVKAADSFLAVDKASGYRVPLRPGQDHLHWGSNGLPLNNGIELGLAYDITGNPKYLDGAADALAYILGRNPLDQSYVTGYGFRPLMNPHHRFWAHQANPAFPGPPPGIVSGGPNSDLQDPYMRAAGIRSCAPMTCFLDHIEAYSVNEECLNWNAPLAWLAAFMDEHRAVRSVDERRRQDDPSRASARVP